MTMFKRDKRTCIIIDTSHKQKHKGQEHQHKRAWSSPPSPRKQAPYPYFENANEDDSTFLVSLFNRVLAHFSESSYADVNKEPSSPVGFMPRSPSPTTPLDVSVPITISRTTSESSDDACSCLSTSSSSSGSLSTSASSSASSSSLSTISENTTPTPLSSSPTSSTNPPTTSNTTLALSDLLCDHYVQERSTATVSTEKEETHDVENKGVPLETFRIFEAPSPDDDERWFAWKSPTDWTPILDDEEDDEDDDNQLSSLPSTQSLSSSSSSSCTMDGDMNDTLRCNNNDDTATIKPYTKSSSSCSSSGKKKLNKRQNPLKHHHHARDIRVNSDHLRMIVAEANMMRAQKIVGPLRPRSYLPKRRDPFTSCRPSGLRY